jgi:hypothetical protein
MPVAAAVAVGVVGSIAASNAQKKATNQAIGAQQQATNQAISAEEKQMQQQRDWQLEDRKYNEAQQLEAEKRQLQYELDAEQRQLQYLLDAEKRGEARDIAAEERSKQYILEQQQLYETKMQKQQDLVLSMSEPYRNLTLQALPELQKMIGDYSTSPLYQMQLEEGLKSIDQQASAQGLYNSGAHLAQKEKFIRELGAYEADKMYERQMGIAQFGANTAAMQGQGLPLPVAQPAYTNSQNSVNVMYPTVGAPTTQATSSGNAPNYSGVFGSIYQNQGNNLAQIYQNAANTRAGLYSNLANTAMAGANAYAMYKGLNSLNKEKNNGNV